MSTSMKQAEILLVEDSPTDVLMTKAAFAEFKITNTLHVVEDGMEALDYLNQSGEYVGVPCPDLILLDLNLPRMNGHELLVEIKSDARFRHIPVVILTTSKAEQDVFKAYTQYASAYITKPVGFNNFIEAMKTIRAFWFSLVTLPTEGENGQNDNSVAAD